MMKALLPLAILALSGCAITAGEQSAMFDTEVHKSDSGQIWTVDMLKKDYMDKIGKPLIAQDTLSCGRNSLCYYNKWAMAHDDGLKDFNANKARMEQDARAAKEAQCQASPECVKKKEIQEDTQIINQLYGITLARHPYDQADFDGAIRRLCRVSGQAQRNGKPLAELQRGISLAEGIDPETRRSSVAVASACWRLSKNGIPDGTVQLYTM